MDVSLSPSIEPPVPLGTVVTWAATVSNANPGTLSYRFRVREIGADFHTVVDYGPNASLDWTAIEHEGTYEIEVSASNSESGETATASAMFELTPLARSGGPVVTPISYDGQKAKVTQIRTVGGIPPAPAANPSVFVYSTSQCPVGARGMWVEFQTANGPVQQTPRKICNPGYTMNFYLAGLRANARFSVHSESEVGTSIVEGPPVTFSTPTASISAPAFAGITSTPTPAVDGILLQSLIDQPSIATDLNGNVLWWSPADISYLTRPVPGGTFVAIGEFNTLDPAHQFFREFDLAGITLAETNAATVNTQLAAMGVHSINAFHHEARKLANGDYLVLAASERILTNVQGTGPVDVIGDTILVLDRNLQVLWAWDSFDHLDVKRMAIFDETCTTAPGPSCPPIYLASTANDWLHGNSAQLTPDGNILYSARHQDWLFKIDYENGSGTGDVLWRLGNGGDFQIVSTDPSPWFSHQHDANFESNNISLDVFDDGNTRAATDPSAHSRGQVLQIDEPTRVATLVLNADVGSYSAAVGSAQRLQNGNYHFDSGFIGGGTSAQSVEVNAAGQVVFGVQFGALEYRSFRMSDLYNMGQGAVIHAAAERENPQLFR